MMKKLTLSLANEAIERILELSADTQITRRMTAKDSPAFHNLTGAIAAYGKTLALLTALQQREEFYEVIGECEFSECVAAFS
jgi:diacylglycerol kinase